MILTRLTKPGRWARVFTLALACFLGTVPVLAQGDVPAAYANAESLVRSHRWDEGIAALQPLLQADPTNVKFLNLMGLGYTGKKIPDKADQYFEAALKVRPDFVPVLKNLAINEAELGQIDSAREHLLTAIKESPGDPVVNLYLGEFAYRQRDYKAAAQYLGSAGDFVTHNPDLLASLAVSEMKTNNHEKSLQAFSGIRADALHPRFQVDAGVALAEAGYSQQAIPYLESARAQQSSLSGLTYDLALCYIAVKRYSDAIDLLTSTSIDRHETVENDNLLAESYEASHETQKAVDVLRRAIALNPEDDDSYIAFASLCMDHQAFEDANKVLIVGLAVHPKSARLLFERGILNAMQDHYDLAEKDFQASADLAPGDNSAYIGLGVTFLETGNAAKAIPLLRKRLEDKPNDANLSYLLGEALLKSDTQGGGTQLNEAQARLESATRLNPKLVEPHISLGTIYLRDGRLQDAVTQLEQARALDPNAKPAYSHLAIAYRRLGEEKKAREVLATLRNILDHERNGSRQPVQPLDTKSGSALNAQPHEP